MEKNKIEMGITVTGTNAIANPLMREQADRMLTAVADGLAAGWEFAKAVNTITEKELFKEDFGSQAKFAKWANVSPARISQIKGACTYATEYEKRNGKPVPPFASVDGCYTLNRVHLDITERNLNEGEFTEWLLKDTKAPNVFSIGAGAIWRKYNEWVAIKTAVEEVEAHDVKEEKASTTEMVIITYDGNDYHFPLDVLKKYAVPVNGKKEEK